MPTGVFRPFLVALVLALAGVVFGTLIQTVWSSDPGQSIGSFLARISLWVATTAVILAATMWIAWKVLRVTFVGLTGLLQLLASGGLQLVLKAKGPERSRPKRSALDVIASGGLALLVTDAAPEPQRRARVT